MVSSAGAVDRAAAHAQAKLGEPAEHSLSHQERDPRRPLVPAHWSPRDAISLASDATTWLRPNRLRCGTPKASRHHRPSHRSGSEREHQRRHQRRHDPASALPPGPASPSATAAPRAHAPGSPPSAYAPGPVSCGSPSRRRPTGDSTLTDDPRNIALAVTHTRKQGDLLKETTPGQVLNRARGARRATQRSRLPSAGGREGLHSPFVSGDDAENDAAGTHGRARSATRP
jgi:hypothetical protein